MTETETGQWLTLLRTMTAHWISEKRTACGKYVLQEVAWQPNLPSDRRCSRCEKKHADLPR